MSDLIQDMHLPMRDVLNALKEILSDKDYGNWNEQLNESEKIRIKNV